MSALYRLSESEVIPEVLVRQSLSESAESDAESSKTPLNRKFSPISLFVVLLSVTFSSSLGFSNNCIKISTLPDDDDDDDDEDDEDDEGDNNDEDIVFDDGDDNDDA